MKILIVGCGAVGQVYGLALQNAGVSLAYLDRPETVDKLKETLTQGGLPLYQLSSERRHVPIPHRLEHFQVVSNLEESRSFGPDQVWFATPSQVYYTEWFREFLGKVPARQVVCFIPEGPRPEFILEGEAMRMVFGGTTFMAWQGDLSGGGGRVEGVNFWLSPLAIPLVGPEAACSEVEQQLRHAGFRVSIGKPGSRQQAAVTALMTTFVAGLELGGWTLRGFRSSPWLRKAAAACGEAILGQLPAASLFQKALLGTPILSLAFWLATLLLPRLVPFSLEKYLDFHYHKTRAQTVSLLELFE